MGPTIYAFYYLYNTTPLGSRSVTLTMSHSYRRGRFQLQTLVYIIRVINYIEVVVCY